MFYRYMTGIEMLVIYLLFYWDLFMIGIEMLVIYNIEKNVALMRINDFKPWMKKILLFQIQRYAKPIIVYSNFTFENNLKHMNESVN